MPREKNLFSFSDKLLEDKKANFTLKKLLNQRVNGAKLIYFLCSEALPRTVNRFWKIKLTSRCDAILILLRPGPQYSFLFKYFVYALFWLMFFILGFYWHTASKCQIIYFETMCGSRIINWALLACVQFNPSSCSLQGNANFSVILKLTQFSVVLY